jgi:hypothetical protein
MNRQEVLSCIRKANRIFAWVVYSKKMARCDNLTGGFYVQISKKEARLPLTEAFAGDDEIDAEYTYMACYGEEVLYIG